MSGRHFYGQWLRRAFRLPFFIGQASGFALWLLVGGITRHWPDIGARLDYFAWLIPLVIFLGSLAAGLISAPYFMYKELEKERDEAKRQLNDKSKVKDTKNVLAAFLVEMDGLFQERIRSDAELDDWGKRANSCIQKCSDAISARFSEADARRFASVGGALAVAWGHQYNDRHNTMLSNLNQYRENLRALVDRL